MFRALWSPAVIHSPHFRYKSMGLKQYIQFRADVGNQIVDEKEKMESIAYEVSEERGTSAAELLFVFACSKALHL